MKIYSEITDKNKSLALALGVFDGVHAGHKQVIKSAVDFAQKNNRKSAVLTFLKHPQFYLNPNFKGCITTLNDRLKIFENLGVDYCYILDFDKIKNFTGEEYIKEILFKNFNPLLITTGFNHHFGLNKSGNAMLLTDLSQELGYEYLKIPPVLINGETVSSSIIRKFLQTGAIRQANLFLGHNFTVSGNVCNGTKMAEKIGFKTANLHYPNELVKIPYGVYAVKVHLKEKSYDAIANFGIKPTFSKLTETPLLEVHLLDFNSDIYGENIRVEFLEFIRNEKKFNNIEELKMQIQQDIMQLQKIIHH